MVKTYSRIDWENEPSTKTPVNETNLNKMDAALNEIDNRVVSLDTTKANVSEVNGLVASIEFNEDTGVFTVTKKDGSKATFDTKLEKIAVNFEYEPTTQKLIIYLDDGTTQEVDLSAFVTQYEFTDGEIITWSVVDGKVTANIKENSIPGNKLEPNYLANCITAKNEAQAAAGSANTSKTLAESYAHGGTGTREGEDTDNAKYYMEQARDIVGGNFIVKPDNPKEGDALIFDGENWIAQTQEQVDVITYGETELEDDVSELASGTMYCQLADGQIVKAWIGVEGIAKPLNVGETPEPILPQVINYTFLYDRGDEHIDITGGLVSNGRGVATKQADYLQCEDTANDGWIGGAFITQKPIDFNQYSNFCMLLREMENRRYTFWLLKSSDSDTSFVSKTLPIIEESGLLVIREKGDGVLFDDTPYCAFGAGLTKGKANIRSVFLAKSDDIQPLADALIASPSISAILAKSAELLANKDLVTYMVYKCTGDFMAQAMANSTFLTALGASPNAQIVLNNQHWKYFLDMIGVKVIEKNMVIYGAKGDNITITDANGGVVVSNVVFDTDATSKEITLNVCTNIGYVFTSNVAKATDGSGADYSKTITITEDMTSIKVMPDGAIYWYGNEVETLSAFACTWSYPGEAPNITRNLNNIVFSMSTTTKAGMVATDNKLPTSNYSATKFDVTSYNSKYIYPCAFNNKASNHDSLGLTGTVNPLTKTGIITLPFASGTNDSYVGLYLREGGNVTVSRIWFE